MIIRWREFYDQPEGIHLHETWNWPQLVRENRQVIDMSEVQADLHLQIKKEELHIQGELYADVTYRCSRCLTDFEQRLYVPFDEVFLKAKGTTTVGEEDDEGHLYVSDEFLLDPYLEQAVQLQVPYFPHCKEDCAGLCPTCGIDRNNQSCDCDTRRIDPRLADLGDFFKQDT